MFLEILEIGHEGSVTHGLVLDDIDDAKGSIFLQANVIGRVTTQVRNCGGQPWLGSGVLNLLLGLAKHEGLRVDVDELEEVLVGVTFALVLLGFSLASLDQVEAWEFVDLVLLYKGFISVLDETELKSFIEVGAESSVDDWRALLVGKEKHLWLGVILRLEGVVVRVSDLDDAVADVLVARLLQFVGVQLSIEGVAAVVEGWDWSGWVHLVGWVLSDTFFLTDLVELIALNRANSEHHFVLERKLFVLTLVSLRVRIVSLVELNDGDSLLSVLDYLFVKVFGVHDLDC